MARRWSNEEAADILSRVYRHVLEREADGPGMINYGAGPTRGELSVRDVVGSIGLSGEYRDRFIRGRSAEEALQSCYQHFLGRDVDPGGVGAYLPRARQGDFEDIIVELINSAEYRDTFGEDWVPSVGGEGG